MYSSVDAKRTPISSEDQAIICRSSFGNSTYFASPTGFLINKALREVSGMAGDEMTNLRKVLRSYSMTSADVDAAIKTIQTMDKNMQPLDGDIQVTRWVDEEYLHAVLRSAGVEREAGEMTSKDVELIKSKLLDSNIQESGFISTSYDESKSLFDGRPIRLNLLVKKGTKAIFSPLGNEAELTISRNSSYKITDATLSEDGINITGVIESKE